jgi:hypothetical protein
MQICHLATLVEAIEFSQKHYYILMHNALKNDMEMNMNFNLKQDDQVG